MIRQWKPSDAAACLEVFQAAVMGGTAYSLPQRRAWATLPYSFSRWRVRQRRNTTLVAELDGCVAGFTEIRPDGHVHMLFVAPNHQKRGIAGALLLAGVSQMTARGVPVFTTWASRSSAPVFTRAGFVRAGALVKPTGTQRILCWRMVRRRGLG